MRLTLVEDVQPAGLAEPLAPGFVHRVNRTRLALGLGVKRAVDGDWERADGSSGFFLCNRLTGYSLGDRHYGSPALPLPQREPGEHSRQVVEYFVGAGLPAASIGRARVWPERAPDGQRLFEVTAVYTLIERVVAGIRVEGSFAWARLAEDGTSLCEGVYWPRLPDEVVEEAIRLDRALAEHRSGPFGETGLGTDLRVVIRHSWASRARGAMFAARAVLEKLER